jgi:hypothetical protein
MGGDSRIRLRWDFRGSLPPCGAGLSHLDFARCPRSSLPREAGEGDRRRRSGGGLSPRSQLALFGKTLTHQLLSREYPTRRPAGGTLPLQGRDNFPGDNNPNAIALPCGGGIGRGVPSAHGPSSVPPIGGCVTIRRSEESLRPPPPAIHLRVRCLPHPPPCPSPATEIGCTRFRSHLRSAEVGNIRLRLGEGTPKQRSNARRESNGVPAGASQC